MGCKVRDRAPRVTRHVGTYPLIFGLLLLSIVVLGQSVPEIKKGAASPDRSPMSGYQSVPGTGVLTFTVFGESVAAHLDRQALIKVVNTTNQTTTWQTTEDHSQGALTNLPYGKYSIEVSAVGYLSSEQEVLVTKSEPAHLDIVLRRDPAASQVDAAVRVVSPQARKAMKRELSELVLNYPDLAGAQKNLDQAYASSPYSAELNYLLGYLNFRKGNYRKATSYLEAATTLRPKFEQALTLLGRARLVQKDYAGAQSALEQAVATDPENWLPHYLLADTDLQQKKYSQARDEAQIAIARGKDEVILARIVLGQALVGLGLNRQGIEALRAVLQESPNHFMATPVRGLIEEARARERQTEPAVKASESETPVSQTDSLEALSSPKLSVASWQPAGIDDAKVAMARGVTCESEKVVEQAGKHVAELADDVARFAAVEDLFHQSVDEFGNPGNIETRKYNYVASISEDQPGFLSINEDRINKYNERQGSPDGIGTTGFTALALVFHPHVRDNFEMQCEGLGEWRGEASWIVHFRQRDDRPSTIHSYKVNESVFPVMLKGRAWITATTFRILRIESEMVRAIPEIQLLSEHQIVEYGPVRFEKKNSSLWLPKSAEIYFDFQRHKYYRRHTFDHYMLFSVDTDEKRKEPVSPPEEKPGGEAEKKSP